MNRTQPYDTPTVARYAARAFLIAMCLILIIAAASCSTVKPNPGQEAVLVYKPLVFGHGGVDTETVKTGLTFVAWTTSAQIVNMQPQQVNVEFDDLMTRDGVPLDFHASVRFKVIDAVALVRDFGNDSVTLPNVGEVPGFFYRSIEQPFRSAVRDAVKQHGLNEMAIDTSAADEVDRKATAALITIIGGAHAPIQLLDMTLGRANPPDAIKHQRIATAEQEQRIKTEQQRKLAEDERRAAELSRAAADSAYNDKMNITSEQYLRLETIKMQREVCAKGGCYFGFTPTLTQAVR